MECWGIYHRTVQENQRLNLAVMNHLEDQIAASIGMPRLTPRIEIPLPTYYGDVHMNTTNNTTNNIKVESGSQVGQINAGSLVYLDRAVSNFNQGGVPALGEALKDFTQSVVDSTDLSADQQHQLLELLKELVGQTAKPKEERNTSVAKLALQNISGIVSAVNLVSAHWESLKKFFEHLIH
jgi:hypothetical protein